MEQPQNIDEILMLWKMEDTGSEFSLYDFSQIVDATDNFSPGKILGEGGFGPVYKVFFFIFIWQCHMYYYHTMGFLKKNRIKMAQFKFIEED